MQFKKLCYILFKYYTPDDLNRLLFNIQFRLILVWDKTFVQILKTFKYDFMLLYIKKMFNICHQGINTQCLPEFFGFQQDIFTKFC